MGDSVSNVFAQWNTFQSSRCNSARNWLYEHYRDYSRAVARRIYSRLGISAVDIEDLYQWADLGLIESIDKFNLDKNVDFRTYSGFRIRGCILNGLAKYSEVTSYYKFKANLPDSVTTAITSGNSNEQLSIDNLVGATLDFGYSFWISMFLGREETCADGSFYSSPERETFHSEIIRKISVLPKRSQEVVRKCYLEEKSFSEIADELNLSKSRVAQLHQQALATLRTAMEVSLRI
ncbi:sigma-70 family RNA polymerase sigma factor [Microbulbifer sp. TYP-18]|uniref:sigma-70 family RNA polymerase sigma factor n=1 Tax=Microbulbifer sp. TYP-18 TaxID=3230024 RepID=UPI0034C6167B